MICTKSTKEHPHKLIILYMYNIASLVSECVHMYLLVCVYGEGDGWSACTCTCICALYDQKVGSTTKLGSGVLLVVFELEM